MTERIADHFSFLLRTVFYEGSAHTVCQRCIVRRVENKNVLRRRDEEVKQIKHSVRFMENACGCTI